MVISLEKSVSQASLSADRPTQKEIHPGSRIRQVSFGFACLEEPHVDRIVKNLTHQHIPSGTDLLVVISDNGSRAAWKLIEPEGKLRKMKEALLDTTMDASEETQTMLKQVMKGQQNLRYWASQEVKGTPVEAAKATETFQQQQRYTNELIAHLRPALSEDQQHELDAYLLQEEQQRGNITAAIKNPADFIEEADKERPSLLPYHPPSYDQIATISSYTNILVNTAHLPPTIRIRLVSGSETGNFGSVRTAAQAAMEHDYQRFHPDAPLESHILATGDMDSGLPQKHFIDGLVAVFSKHPDAPAIRANIGLAWDRKKRPGEVINVPMPKEIANVFGDYTNFAKFFNYEGRKARHIIPRGQGLSGLLGLPNLLIGPAIIMRGSTLRDIGGMNPLDGQGEDIATSSRLHRYTKGQHLPSDRRARIYFNTRAVKNPFLLFTEFEEAIVPHKHQELERRLGKEGYRDFRENRHGYMHRNPLVGEIIRTVEEPRYNLQPNEYVIAYKAAKKSFERGYFNQPEGKNQRLVENVFDPSTGYYFQALIGKLPIDVGLTQGEYISREISQKERATVEEERHRGERIVDYTDPNGNRHFYLLRRHFTQEDMPSSNFFIT